MGGLGGLILGVALSATVGGALGLSFSPSPGKSQTKTAEVSVASSISLPQLFVLPVVKNDEIEAAIKDFPIKVSRNSGKT